MKTRAKRQAAAALVAAALLAPTAEPTLRSAAARQTRQAAKAGSSRRGRPTKFGRPSRAVISGPTRLRGQRLESPDIRAGMAMLIAALCADGVSEIGNVRQIDRGYEDIDGRLRALGARIERQVA